MKITTIVRFMSEKKNNGFSIIEIMVVITIITIGLVGLLALTAQNIKVLYTNRNNLVAAYLAQEGLELIRGIRDNNWKSGYAWNNGIGSGNYVLDYTGYISGGIGGIDSATAKLQLSPQGFYYHDQAPPLDPDSNFSRLITISGDSASSSVVARVRFRSRGQTSDYLAETILYDWR